VLATTAPLGAEALATIADELLVQPDELIVAVAAEMRLKYFLECVYQIPRAPRFLRVRGSLPPISAHAAADHERRRYLDVRAEEVLRASQRLARGSRELLPFVVAANEPVRLDPDPIMPPSALDAIRAAGDREGIATHVLDAIDRCAPTCDAAVLLLVRRETAIGWRSFSRLGAPVPEVVVPLKYQGLVPRAVTTSVTTRMPFAGLHPVDQMLLHMLGKDHGDLVIVPIATASQVSSLIACATAAGAEVEGIEACAAAAGEAFGRLVHAAAGAITDRGDRPHGGA
jgi:hypothetical protein